MGMESKFVWMNGELVPFEKATIHCADARLALRRGGVRGHSRVRYAEGPGCLPPDRPCRTPARFGAGFRLPRSAVDAGQMSSTAVKDTVQRQRLQGLLHPSACYTWTAAAGT
ncbi:MAG: hypothetical protein MZU91_02345 [Desulfosudis oleivorans]|nr:hypothetical protein [Desulfosudis oleivorans]